MPPSTPSGSANRTRWLVAVVAVAIVALVVWVVTRPGDDSPGDPAANASASPDDGSTGQPVESSVLIDLSESGRSVSFHAVYEATSAETVDAIGFSRVELWRSEGWTRQDTTAESQDGTMRTQAVRNPDGVVTLCVLSTGGVWGCTEQQTDTDNDLFLAAAALMAPSGPVARETTIGENAATCFSDPSELGAEVCYREDGVPLRLATEPGVGLEITSIDTDVDDSVFTTPEPGSTEVPADGNE